MIGSLPQTVHLFNASGSKCNLGNVAVQLEKSFYGYFTFVLALLVIEMVCARNAGSSKTSLNTIIVKKNPKNFP